MKKKYNKKKQTQLIFKDHWIDSWNSDPKVLGSAHRKWLDIASRSSRRKFIANQLNQNAAGILIGVNKMEQSG